MGGTVTQTNRAVTVSIRLALWYDKNQSGCQIRTWRFSHTNIHTHTHSTLYAVGVCRAVTGLTLMWWKQVNLHAKFERTLHTQHLANKNHALHVHNAVCVCRAVTGSRKPALICQILTYISHMHAPTVASVKPRTTFDCSDAVCMCRAVTGPRRPALICQILTYISHIHTPTVASVKKPPILLF